MGLELSIAAMTMMAVASPAAVCEEQAHESVQELVHCLLDQGDDLIRAGRYAEGSDAIERAVDLGIESPTQRIHARRGIAFVERVIGSPERAMEILREGIQEEVEAGRPDANTTLMMQSELAGVLLQEMRPEEALEIMENSRSLVSPTSVQVDNIDITTLQALHMMGRDIEAREVGNDAHRRLVAEDRAESFPMSVLLIEMGNVSTALGAYREARTTLEAGYDLTVKLFGHEHPQVPGILQALATLHDESGDYVSAVRISREALAIDLKLFGEGSRQVADDFNALAIFLGRTGNYAEALEVRERGLAILQEILEPDDPRLLGVQLNLAKNYKRANKLDQAMAMYRALLPRVEANPARRISAYAGIAEVLHAQGHREEASAAYEANYQRKIAYQGPDHPTLAPMLVAMAQVNDHMGRPDRARHYISESLRISAQVVEDLLGATSEREALALLLDNRQALDWYLRIFDRPEDHEVAYAEVLRWKGIVSRMLGGQRQWLSSESEPHIRESLDALQHARSVLSQEILQPFDAELGDARRTRVEQLRQEKERLERELAMAAGDHSAPEAPSPATICTVMKPDEALVDFVRFSGRYLAFILSGSDCSRVVRVDLGVAAPLDEAIADYRTIIASPTNPVRDRRRAERLTTLLWAPLQSSLSGARTVYIVPDGGVAHVSFAALPAGEERYLIEDHLFSYLDHAGSLAEPAANRSTVATALVVGDVDFGPSQDAAAGLCMSGGFDPLPATSLEIERIAKRLSRGRSGIPVKVLRGAEATTAAVAERAVSARIIHLATHGFFATDACQSALDGEDVDGSISGANPMVLSGLVLADANRIASPGDRDDGLWTAEEVASLDLRDTELVVLSACETGLGAVQSGEGVLGLRRAFAGAGARILIMSLWSVPDDATSRLMTDLYSALTRGRRRLAPSEALREAQLVLLAHNREAFGEAYPIDWGGFITSGRPSRLRP